MSVADERLDEQALRRETFRDGPKVILGDGQEWTFPRPRIRFFPRNNEAYKAEARCVATYGREYELKIDEFLETDPEDAVSRIMIQVEMAALLLLENYDLGDVALADLLTFDSESSSSLEMWENITQVLLGRAPKALPDGSA